MVGLFFNRSQIDSRYQHLRLSCDKSEIHGILKVLIYYRYTPMTCFRYTSASHGSKGCTASDRGAVLLIGGSTSARTPLHLYFADLNRWLDVRVVGNVSHDGLSVGPESALKSFHRFEEHVEHHVIDGW